MQSTNLKKHRDRLLSGLRFPDPDNHGSELGWEAWADKWERRVMAAVEKSPLEDFCRECCVLCHQQANDEVTMSPHPIFKNRSICSRVSCKDRFNDGFTINGG